MDSATGLSWVEVDLAALRHNVELLRRAAGGAALAAVVKADGYGHGAAAAARAALEAGAERLCVFTVGEAAALRRAGLRAPILLLGPLLPNQLETAVQLELAVTVRTATEARALAQASQTAGRRTAVHINIDAGMQRLGLSADAAALTAGAVRESPPLRLEGVYTHLPDAFGGDPAPTRAAFRQFLQHAARIGAPIRHAAASAALLRFPETALEMVRPGLALYGAGPLPGAAASGLQPALSWRAPLLMVRTVRAGQSVSYGGRWTAQHDSVIGVIGAGYADGLRRSLWSSGEVLIHGRRAPLAGTICMDMAMADLTHVPNAAAGDVVTLIGRDGPEHISAAEMAERCGTIAYELLTGIAPRVQRIYT